MRWVVGLGLKGDSMGAVKLAGWLTEHGVDHVYGVHVLRRTELFGLAERALDDLARRTRTTALFEVLCVVQHADVANALVETCAEHAADMLLLGRRARSSDATPVRLGRVTRRLLRTLPGPVAIVPPDFDPPNAGTGPVLAATDLSDDSVAACVRARALAERLHRALVLVHVVPDPHDWGLSILSEAHELELANELLVDAEARLGAWCHRHDLSGLQAELRKGDVVEQLMRVGTELRTPITVVGSRRLGLLARVFSASVGSALSASAPWPVVVVPPALADATGVTTP